MFFQVFYEDGYLLNALNLLKLKLFSFQFIETLANISLSESIVLLKHALSSVIGVKKQATT